MTTSALDTTPTRGFRAWAARRPIAAFLLLLFGIGYPLMSLPILAHKGLIPGASLPGMLGLDTERFTALLMVVAVMLPATLWVTWAAEGRDGLRTLLGRSFRWRFGAGWWLVVLFALPTLTLVFTLLLGGTLKPIADPVALVVQQVVALLIAFVVINLWEETAWMGLVQTRLERRHNLVVAAILTAIPFALIHMPLQLIGEFSVSSVMLGMVLVTIFSSVVRLMFGVVLRGVQDSVFAIGLLHSVFNQSNNVDGVVASLAEGDSRGLGALIATIVLTAAVALVFRLRMSRAYRRELDARAFRPAPGDDLPRGVVAPIPLAAAVSDDGGPDMAS